MGPPGPVSVLWSRPLNTTCHMGLSLNTGLMPLPNMNILTYSVKVGM